MQPGGDQLLARTPLANDQHRPIMAGRPGTLINDFQKSRTFPDQRLVLWSI